MVVPVEEPILLLVVVVMVVDLPVLVVDLVFLLFSSLLKVHPWHPYPNPQCTLLLVSILHHIFLRYLPGVVACLDVLIHDRVGDLRHWKFWLGTYGRCPNF